MSNKIEYFKSLKDMYQTEKLAKIPTQIYLSLWKQKEFTENSSGTNLMLTLFIIRISIFLRN